MNDVCHFGEGKAINNVAVLTMARKTTKRGDGGSPHPDDEPNPRKSPDEEPRKIVVTIRGRPTWKSWLDGFAGSERVSSVVLIDRALALYAKHVGYANPPER